MSQNRPQIGALAVLYHEGKFLLAQRRNPPDAGLWGFAGGQVEFGETVCDAAARELQEETGLVAHPAQILNWGEAISRDEAGRARHHHILAAVLCRDPSGTLHAADDVMDVAWVTLAQIESSTYVCSARVDEVARAALDAMLEGGPAQIHDRQPSAPKVNSPPK